MLSRRGPVRYELNGEWITVAPLALLLLPAICGVFDGYCRQVLHA